MTSTIFSIAILGGIALLLCVGYPLATIAAYPIYRWLGGRQSFRKYMRDM